MLVELEEDIMTIILVLFKKFGLDKVIHPDLVYMVDCAFSVYVEKNHNFPNIFYFVRKIAEDIISVNYVKNSNKRFLYKIDEPLLHELNFLCNVLYKPIYDSMPQSAKVDNETLANEIIEYGRKLVETEIVEDKNDNTTAGISMHNDEKKDIRGANARRLECGDV